MDQVEQKPNERPAPPPLQPRSPDCPLCTRETNWQDDGYACEDCSAWWPERVTGEEPGEWLEADEAQCEETVAPYVHNLWIPANDPRKHLVFRCLLTENHGRFQDQYGHPLKHANHEMTSCVRGWN
jgi:hypothetical protein